MTKQKQWKKIGIWMKFFFNNIAELHAILKILIWSNKTHRNSQEFLNQKIWIFSNSQRVFKFIKNVHCTEIAYDIKKNIKFLINKESIFNFQSISKHMDIPGNEKTNSMTKLKQLLSKKKELYIFFDVINNKITLQILKKWKKRWKHIFSKTSHISHSTCYPNNAISKHYSKLFGLKAYQQAYHGPWRP